MRETAKLATVMVVLSATCAFAADWPWIYGPARNSTSDQKSLPLASGRPEGALDQARGGGRRP